MNNVFLIGRLTADPELRYLPSNAIPIARFTIAVEKDMSKEKKEETKRQGKPTADFPRITAWGRQAENSANYLKKGSLVAIQGRIQTSKYQTQEGRTVYTTEVVAERVKFLERRNNQQEQDITSQVYGPGFEPVPNEEIPF